jgi:ribosomal protein S18 acetylase RimI-like enzyme
MGRERAQTFPRSSPRSARRARDVRDATSTALRTATTRDVDHLTAVLARAFDADPVARWFVFQDQRRRERAHRLFNWYLRDAVSHGISTTTPSLAGVAVWSPPNRWKMSPWRQLLLLPEILRVTGSANLVSRVSGINRMARSHPVRPHYYLAALGVEPALQGQGIGTALLQPTLALCDTSGTPAYLENTSETNLGLYERHGFSVVREITMPDGPRQWLMWREPRR